MPVSKHRTNYRPRHRETNEAAESKYASFTRHGPGRYARGPRPIKLKLRGGRTVLKVVIGGHRLKHADRLS